MDKRSFENYEIEDFITDESFINYHFHSNEKDRIFWEKWLRDNPSKRHTAKEAVKIIQALSLTLNEKEYQEEFDKIKTAINKKSRKPLFRLLDWNKNSFQGQRRKSLQYAISVFIILIGITIFWLIPHFKNKSIALNNTVNSGNTSMVLTLSDSTVVTLSPNSSLEYPSSFEGANRQVYLKGEANFHVKRNEHFPFKVHAKDIVTTVLGTVFNIKKAGDSAIVVELLKGKVKVEIEDSANTSSVPLMLSPDEKAIYVFNDKRFYKNETLFSLSFHKNSFEQIAARIKSVYGITVINRSDKKQWRFTGDFKNISAKEIIENICVIKNLNSKVVGDTIFINN